MSARDLLSAVDDLPPVDPSKMKGWPVTLRMSEPDSMRVLRAALANACTLHRKAADYHDATGKIRRSEGDASEANRHRRTAAEYQRRAALAQQLLDQLPDEPAPTAPKG